MEKRRQPEIIAGRVNADGSIAAGDGFTVNKTGTGTYQMSFASGFRLIGGTASAGGGVVAATTSYPGSNVLQVVTSNSSFIATDGPLSFTAVGVQQ